MKCNFKILVLVFLFFIMGMVFITNDTLKAYNEPFVSGQCPTTMIKNGEHIMVYNPRMAKIPGVNPIILNDLEDYKEYVRWQKKNRLNCPILHLEKVFDTQGQEMYEIKPSFDTTIPVGALNHSMPVIREHPKSPDSVSPFLPGFDPYNQTVGSSSNVYPKSASMEPNLYLRKK